MFCIISLIGFKEKKFYLKLVRCKKCSSGSAHSVSLSDEVVILLFFVKSLKGLGIRNPGI